MKQQRYVLTIQNASIFREIDVSPQMPSMKIGTTQDCDVRIKRELFPAPVQLELCLQGDAWHIRCGSGLRFRSDTVQGCTETVIRHGDILQLEEDGKDETLLSFAFSYDFTLGDQGYDTIVDIRNLRRLVIGGTNSAQIRLESGFVGEEFIELTREQNGSLTLDPSHAPTSATLNGIRVFEKSVVREYDFVGIADYSFYFRNQVLYTAGRQDMRYSGVSSQPLREETPAFTYPKLNRGPRMRWVFNRDPIEILSPPKKPERPRDNLVLQLSPALAMMAVTVITRSGLIAGLQVGNPAFLIFSLSTMAVGIFTTILSFVYNRKRYKQDLEIWRSDYENYIAAKSREIEEEQREEVAALLELYPSGETLRDFVKTFSPRLFERSPREDDFLHARIGLGPVPPLRLPSHQHEEKIKVENELAEIPDELCRKYALLSGAPVMLHLRESGTVGVAGARAEQYDFFKSLLLDLCIQHDYEEVQVIVLIPEGVKALYDWVRWMPHIKNSGKEGRGIVCDAESRDSLFEYLYGVITERAMSVREEETAVAPTPHIVLFALEEYGIRTHPLYKFIDELPKLGISFVFFKEHPENLPQACMEVVELTPEGGTLRRREDRGFACTFTREHVADESIRFAAERLAPVYCDKIALSSRLTANITLFELLNILSPDNLDLNGRWKASNVQRSLAAPIGVDATGGVVCLDLHEKAHGPHGLVAGTTGSGKSEIMQSFILSAAVNYHPYELAFVIIDFKGGGMANQFDRLPHLIGKITDIDSYGINRSLLSIRAELEKRKRLFAQQEVNHIDEYIGKYRRGEAETPLPHLVLIVDEFAELKAEQPDFMKELISTARVGRSLGIHLILATQKPSGQVNEQIWSNSRFKLCLKVATKEDSVEVLRSPLAAEIREPGRAYMQVGNNEIFTLFQSAYSGASAASDQNGSIREFSISEVDFTGKRTVIYQRKAEHSSDGTKITQLKVLVNYIHDYCQRLQLSPLPSICMPPLPETIPYASKAGKRGVEVAVGLYDDPANQVQPEVRLDLAAGNVMIIGSAQSGKTLLLQTILRGIAEQNTPGQVSVYILDFASKVMKAFEELNHVGGVLTDTDDEKMKSFIKMMREELYARKELFSQRGISSYEAYLEMKDPDMPSLARILIMVDNLAIFRDSFPDHEEAMINLCREGLAVGITVIATAKQTGGLGYKYLNSFAQRIAFNCTEASEYGNLFDRCQLRPQNIQGRGLVSVNKTVYEYQAFLPFSGATETRRMEAARGFIAGIGEKCGSERARQVPSIPRVFTNAYWAASGLRFPDFTVPVGLTYSEVEPLTVDLAHVGSLGILGREGFGKSNLLSTLLDYLRLHVFDLDCEAYLLDSYDHQLEAFRNCGFVREFTLDCGDFEDFVETFQDAARERMELLESGKSLEEEPLLLCVVQNPKIFSAGAVDKKVCDSLRRLLNDAGQLKMCFILSDIENNADYSPPEMVRLSRELARYILLEDLGSVKFLGSNKFTPADLKTYKKPLSLGEGYSYGARTGLEKIRLAKWEGGDRS